MISAIVPCDWLTQGVSIANMLRTLTRSPGLNGIGMRLFLSCGSTTKSGARSGRGELEKSASVQQSPKLEPLQEETKGFDKVLQRAASILINISERSMMKVLHVNCGGKFGYYLGRSTVLDITGVSMFEDQIVEANSQKQYTEVVSVSNYDLRKQFRNGMFQAVISLQPGDSATLSIQDALRVMTDDGFIVFGAKEEVWDRDGVMQQMEEAEAGGSDAAMAFSATLLSVQTIDCGEAGSYYLGLMRKRS